MKYRRLSISELQTFEKEFVIFLSANGISGPDWEKMKTNNDPMVDAWIDDFSDYILDRVIENVHYIDFRSPEMLVLYHCEGLNSEAIIVQNLSGEGKDISQPETLFTVLKENPDGLKLSLASKKHENEDARKQFIFGELSRACLITDEKLFQALRPLL